MGSNHRPGGRERVADQTSPRRGDHSSGRPTAPHSSRSIGWRPGNTISANPAERCRRSCSVASMMGGRSSSCSWRLPRARRSGVCLDLGVSAHPSGAYVAILGDSWDAFYAAKRSSSTRKREQRQLKQLAEHGTVGFVNVVEPEERAHTITTLLEHSVELRGRRVVPPWPGPRAPQRVAAACHRQWVHAVRFHRRRRTLQA